jgi:GPH family glycoside/pentoside/hexuronide:cation symporter
LVPKLIKRFNYKQLIITGCGIGVVSCLIIFFLGYGNFWACVPFLVLACVPAGFINVLGAAMIGDALDYMEWKTGRRENGLGSACQSFVNKLGNALSTTFIVLMYMFVDLRVDTIGTQFTVDPNTLAPSVRSGMFLIVSLIPAISLAACAVPVFFYDLVGEKRQRITRELHEQREALGIVVE